MYAPPNEATLLRYVYPLMVTRTGGRLLGPRLSRTWVGTRIPVAVLPARRILARNFMNAHLSGWKRFAPYRPHVRNRGLALIRCAGGVSPKGNEPLGIPRGSVTANSCRYCVQIHEHDPRYEVRRATHARESSFPRCDFHWRFVCDHCGQARIFHGVAYCPRRDAMICVDCSPEQRAVRRRFWGWTYYFTLRCPWHPGFHPALDRLEHDGRHPWQLRPRDFRRRRGRGPASPCGGEVERGSRSARDPIPSGRPRRPVLDRGPDVRSRHLERGPSGRPSPGGGVAGVASGASAHRPARVLHHASRLRRPAGPLGARTSGLGPTGGTSVHRRGSVFRSRRVVLGPARSTRARRLPSTAARFHGRPPEGRICDRTTRGTPAHSGGDQTPIPAARGPAPGAEFPDHRGAEGVAVRV